MKTAEYLDAAKSASQLPSDYALAARLNVKPSAVSNWRSGRALPEPLIAYRLAELAQRDPLLAITDIELERAERAERLEAVSAWRSIIRKLGGMAAGVAVAVGATAVSAPSPAQAHQPSDMSQDVRGVCVMSTIVGVSPGENSPPPSDHRPALVATVTNAPRIRGLHRAAPTSQRRRVHPASVAG